MKKLLRQLVKIAEQLDQSGMTEEADFIDDLLIQKVDQHLRAKTVKVNPKPYSPVRNPYSAYTIDAEAFKKAFYDKYGNPY